MPICGGHNGRVFSSEDGNLPKGHMSREAKNVAPSPTHVLRNVASELVLQDRYTNSAASCSLRLLPADSGRGTPTCAKLCRRHECATVHGDNKKCLRGCYRSGKWAKRQRRRYSMKQRHVQNRFSQICHQLPETATIALFARRHKHKVSICTLSLN
jgi:hypothetical protein